MIDQKTIEYFKANKNLITEELLDELRKTKEGKQIALDMLDLEKDQELFYLDAFGNKISFNGNRQLKKAFTKLNLSNIHIKEIEKCAKSLQYFRNNYVKIKTPTGINFPDLRPYQDKFLNEIDSNNESFVVLFPRQSGKSITTAIYLAWQFIFNKDLNIGICANKGNMSKEFLNNVKNILCALPIWLQQGIKVWNKGSIESENGMRILTDVPSADSFRGFSIALLVVDECIEYNTKITLKFKNKEFNTSIGWFYDKMAQYLNNDVILIDDYEVLTSNGFKKFRGIKKSIHNSGLKITLENKESIICTENHKFFINDDFKYAKDLKISDSLLYKNNKIKIFNIEKVYNKEYFDLLDVDDGHHYTANGIEVSNCAYIPTTKWNEFLDGIMPSQSSLAWKKNILLSTANGMNHFYEIVKGARKRKSINDITQDELNQINQDEILEKRKNTDGTYNVIIDKPSNGYKLIEVDWKEVPRYDQKGNLKDPNVFKQEIIDKYGIVYFNQAYANFFVGSSYTLVNSETLGDFSGIEPISIKDGLLKIYNKPKKKNKYILSVDPAKDGSDSFSVHVINITKFPFVQDASCDLQIDYFKMPEFLNEWGKYYNTAFIIIENNEGAGQSVADMLYNDYEYENLFFDKNKNSQNIQKRKKYPGFRTTTLSRKLILDTLKLFLENKNLILNDTKTINQFYTFVLINGKYQAEDGYHDDLIMSLAISFAPFMNLKNFVDMKKLIKNFYNNDNENYDDFTEFLTIGFFDN